MSEQQQDKLENLAPEAVEDIAEQRMVEDRENAPAEKEKKAAKPARKKAKRRKKRRGVPVIAVIFLLIIALLFGVVLGYSYGRSTSSQRLEAANDQIDELTGMVVEASGEEIDVFTESVSAENAAALSELSGEASEPEANTQTGAMMSGEAFGSEQAVPTEDVIVAEYKGGKLTGLEVGEEYNRQMTSFVFAGFDEEEVAATLLEDVMQGMVSDRVLKAEAKKLGLLELSSADKGLIEAEARSSYNEQVDYYRSAVRREGMSEDEVTAAAEAALEQQEGVTYDSVYADLESGWWSQKLYDHVIADVTVDSAAVLALYQDRLAEQKENFTANPDGYEYAQKNGEIILYNLPGYRAVKLLQLNFEDEGAIEAVAELKEELSGLNPQSDTARISEIQNQLNAFYASPDARAKTVQDKLAAGEDFDTLLRQYGADIGMMTPLLRESGYFVSTESLLWDPELITAAMALQNPGEVSPAVRVGDGVCILCYVGEVAAGEVDLDEVTAALTEEALLSAQLEAYEAQVNAWITAADAKYYPERMQ